MIAKTHSDLKETLLALLIDPLPATVRSSLLLDGAFCTTLGIVPKFWFPLSDDKVVDADSLHNALRTAVSGGKSATIALRGGQPIRVDLKRHKNGKATLVLKKQRFSFSDADLLTSNRRARLRAFKRVLTAKPLLVEEEERWNAIAEERTLTDREYVDLMSALTATPEALRDELQKRQDLDADKLIPIEPRYYQRLIAPLSRSTNLDAFIADELSSTRSELLERHSKRALRRIAFGALWHPLVPFDLLASTSVSDVVSLLEANDPFSLLFGFELCRERFSTDAAYVDLGQSFLDALLLDPRGSKRRCSIFSAVALISTTSLWQAVWSSNVPLFWVRLAALTHAGVVTDALSGLADTKRFQRWAVQSFYPTYVWHSVVDRRDAPRWKPDWIDPDHLYAELIGRVQGSIRMIPGGNCPPQWVSAIESAIEKLPGSVPVLAAYFPGPFDDFREAIRGAYAPGVFAEVEANLESASTLSDASGLTALAYATQPSDRVVKNVLRILRQPVDQPIANRDQEFPLLRVCSHIAACTRSEAIAQAIINRCLFDVRAPESEAAVTDLFLIMAEACAAYSEPQKYREQLGVVAANLCFAIEKNEDLSDLNAVFDVLAIRDEKLIPALARARAIARTKMSRS